MTTIEERAREYAEKEDLLQYTDEFKYCQKDYIAGANAQKEIDDAELRKLKSSWEEEAQINHNDESNYKQGYHDAVEKACSILEDMTEGRLGKRFISQFKNKLKYGVLERH